MGETRVNLKHLLEDIRDSYPFPLEEAIVIELMANALDSGASEIRFLAGPELLTLTVIDNGNGMTPKELEEYHDIAATTKVRGKGIGFAGVGIKLALLLADSVVTETKSSRFHGATRWHLKNAQRAPWEFIDPKGDVSSFSGTSVTIVIQDEDADLLRKDFIEQVVQAHFYPILDEEFMDKILKYVYKKGVRFFVNGEMINLPKAEPLIEHKTFLVQLGRRAKPIGIGFISKSKEDLREDERGIAVSTYGKVIKRGWDWIGITPRNPMRLTGIVEIPKLSEILTTNKADFLKDMVSLQKYYRYRKAIQQAIEPILREIGEVSLPRERPEKGLRPLEKEIERVLGDMLDDFPELSPLMGRRGRGETISGVLPDPNASAIGTMVEGVGVMTGSHGGSGEGSGVEAAPGSMPGERIEPGAEPTEPGLHHEGRRKRPGLMIGFEDVPDREDLSWLLENTIWVNKGHPAYHRAVESGSENYHIILSVAWVLSKYLEGEKSPQEFINRFLSLWGSRL